MTAPIPLPFDRVVVQTPEGVSRLTIAEFMAISLRQRVQYILGNQLEFFLANVKVEQTVAMRALMVGAIGARPQTHT